MYYLDHSFQEDFGISNAMSPLLDAKSEAERLSNLSKISELINVSAGFSH